ncbi:MAG: DUF1178 family protein [Pararhodobacter sp.]
MIRYRLRCAQGHEFESWFASAAAYDGLRAAGHLSCAICGESSVEKALMAPAVGAPSPPEATETAVQTTSAAPPKTDLAARIAAYRQHVEETSDYVGTNFAQEARAMHMGEVPDRPIYGEARVDEARALISEGVPVAPLPFIPRRNAN